MGISLSRKSNPCHHRTTNDRRIRGRYNISDSAEVELALSARSKPPVQIRDAAGWEAGRDSLEGAEREHWWKLAVEAYPPYADYQVKTTRLIPVFVVE
jgi:hypothetical protein